MRGTLAVCALLVTLSTAAAQAPANVPTALKPFQGVWRPESIQFDGAEQIDKKAKDELRLSIENGSYKLFQIADASKGLGYKVAACALTVTNNSFELQFIEGPRKGQKMHGIFEVTEKTLKLCYGPAEKAMPKTFEAGKSTGNFNEVWVREK